MRSIVLTVALAMGIAAPAVAQQPLKLDFHNGLVSIEANSVPVRTILTEWGKVGGTKIVGAERVAGAPLTLKLVNVSEAKALETILRSVAGYMAAPRAITAAGPSRYDRILVMATSSAPAPAATTRAPQQTNAAQRFVPPRPVQRDEQPEPDEQMEPDENPPNPPVFTFPQPGQQPGQFNGVPMAQPGMMQPQPGNQPQNITISPTTTPGRPTTPGMPVGVSTPGMMVQPPQPVQPPNQPNMIKPPGQNQ